MFSRLDSVDQNVDQSEYMPLDGNERIGTFQAPIPNAPGPEKRISTHGDTLENRYASSWPGSATR